jgi:hypothetical protein
MSVNVLIAFYSRTGSTEALPQSVAEGAGGQSGTAPTPDDLEVARFQGRRVSAVAAALNKSPMATPA